MLSLRLPVFWSVGDGHEEQQHTQTHIFLMSLWLPRLGHTARHCSRTLCTHRSPIFIHQASCLSFSSVHRPLLLSRSKSTQADVSNASSVNPDKPSPPAPKDPPPAPLSTRVWKKVKHEAQHYWHGSKLLVSDVRIASKLQWKILHGETLTRRERRQV